MKSKYNAKKTIIDGIKFDSKKEGAYYLKLKQLEKAGMITDLKLQVPFQWVETHSNLDQAIHFKRKYIADFTCIDYNKDLCIIDVKGYKTEVYKKKKKIVEKIFNIIITEV